MDGNDANRPANDDPGIPGENAPRAAAQQDELAAALGREAELKDRLLRALAEGENLRRRSERDKEDALQYGITRFARDLLGVIDNFQRALGSVPKNLDEKDPLKPLLDGVLLTEKELARVLGLHGVKPVNAIGAKFDPHVHQAIAQVPAPDKPEGTVIEVAQAGYMLGDRLLRPAMVVVSTGGPSQAPNGSGSVDTRA